jgi:hypothetical protein
MVVAVMRSAKRHGEFVADLSSYRPRLRKAEMVGVGGTSAANQTWMRCDEFEMALVAMPARLADREFALLDFARSGRLEKCQSCGRVVGDRLRRD